MKATLREIRGALAVARHLSFRRAAEAIGVSQPTLSAMVAGLEVELGLPLFYRTTRSVQPTEAGQAFLVTAERILGELDDLFIGAETLKRSRRGRVVVTCLSSIAARLMPIVIQRCRAQFPELEILISDDVATRILEAVASGEADFAITGSLKIPSHLAQEDLMTDELHVVCGREHPLSAARSVAWKDLAGEDLITLASNSGVHALIDAALAATRVVVARHIEVSQLATIYGMAEARLGVTVLPRLALPAHDHPSLVARPLVKPTLSRPIRLIWRRDRSFFPPAHRAFVEVVRGTCATYLAEHESRQKQPDRRGSARPRTH